MLRGKAEERGDVRRRRPWFGEGDHQPGVGGVWRRRCARFYSYGCRQGGRRQLDQSRQTNVSKNIHVCMYVVIIGIVVASGEVV